MSVIRDLKWKKKKKGYESWDLAVSIVWSALDLGIDILSNVFW